MDTGQQVDERVMTSRRSQVLGWIEDGVIAPSHIFQALKVTGITPDGPHWRRFIDQLLLSAGALALTCAVVFFIAYNWDALGRFPQFALVQLLMGLAVVFYLGLGAEHSTAKVALLVAAVLLGALLALYGQTYQTGADPWQLFATWALMMLPWVLVGRFAALWLLWLGLLNLAAIFYYQVFPGLFWITFGSKDELFWLLLLLNTAAWAVWEMAAVRFEWLGRGRVGGRWAVRVLATASGTAMTMLVLRAIFDPAQTSALTWLVYVAWLAILYFIYRRKLPDLFMLAGACLSVIVSVTSVCADFMLQGDIVAGTFLLLAVLVVAQAAGAAIWLRRIQAEQAP
jgi:uncharacterized membrane protein